MSELFENIEQLKADNDRLRDTIRVLEDKLSASIGYKNITLSRELLEALGVQDVPLDSQLQAALDAVKALKASFPQWYKDELAKNAF